MVKRTLVMHSATSSVHSLIDGSVGKRITFCDPDTLHIDCVMGDKHWRIDLFNASWHYRVCSSGEKDDVTIIHEQISLLDQGICQNVRKEYVEFARHILVLDKLGKFPSTH